jgi:hypothetical protein
MSALHRKADMCGATCDVSFGPLPDSCAVKKLAQVKAGESISDTRSYDIDLDRRDLIDVQLFGLSVSDAVGCAN